MYFLKDRRYDRVAISLFIIVYILLKVQTLHLDLHLPRDKVSEELKRQVFNLCFYFPIYSQKAILFNDYTISCA